METKKILAIDPGFDRVGLAVMTPDGGKAKILFSQCLKTNPKKSHAERLFVIGEKIEEVISKWQPEILAIETLFFNTNTTSAIGVAEARGIIIYKAVKAGLEVFEYSPQAIKIAVTSHGRADKKQVASMVKKLIYLPTKTAARVDDEIDAIALGITHLATKGGI